MKIRLYADEDSMARSVIRALRSHDVDILTPLDMGMIDSEDIDELEYAKSVKRVIVTYNVKDFARLHKAYLTAGKTHAGMILIRQQEYSTGEEMRRILKLINALSAEQ